MSKVFIEESTLTSIGNAIREKGGTTELIAPLDMSAAITNLPSGGGGEVEPIVLTGNCDHACVGAIPNKYIELYGNTISTKNIQRAAYMFYEYKNEYIPFDINFLPGYTSSDTSSMFFECYNLKTVPKLLNLTPSNLSSMFGYCYNIKEFPEEIYNTWNWSYMDGLTSAYAGSMYNIFSYCFSLRKLPMGILNHGNPNTNPSYSIYYYLCRNCYSLDEIVDLPFPHYKAVWTSNSFPQCGLNCNRLKNFTFKLQENGMPVIVNWKSQTIDLTTYVGYTSSSTYILNYNSGITADKEVKDDATYQALKDDPDWFTTLSAYSRYNHDSAVETINSLPDTSAYLATAGGTNTIKFQGACGSATDGGAINTLTEEEIAVAAAKGWSVALV